MPQPTPYTPTIDFSQQEASNASGRSTVNTAALDTELANIETTLDQALANLTLIQRDDGRLKDLACELHTLSPEVLNLLGGFNLRGLWLPDTAYAVNDIVSNAEYTYLCQIAHTSGAVFDGQYWIQFGFSGGADAAQAAAAAQVSANEADASADAAAAAAVTANGYASTATTQAGNAATSAGTATAKAGEASTSATNAANSASTAQTAAANLPNATTAGASKFLQSNSAGTGWDYKTAAQALVSLSATLAGIAAGTTPTSFRNKLPNGAFRTNQRAYVSGAALAVGVPSTGVGYAHDGWRAGTLNSAYTFTQTATYTTITITAGTFIAAAEDSSIDSATMLLVWQGTAQARVGVNGAAPSGAYAASPIAITCTPGQKVSAEFGTGTLGKVKLINGSVDDGSYEYPPPEAQSARCLRYLPSWSVAATNKIIAYGQVYSSSAAQIGLIYPVPPRVSPTGILTVGTFAVLTATGTVTSSATPTFDAATDMALLNVSMTGLSGLVAGDSTALISVSTGVKIFGTGCEL